MNRLEIIPVGSPEFPRFIIQDTGGLVFDGEKMVNDHKMAVVFAEGQQVAMTFNALQEAQFGDMPLTEFSVTLNVRVRAGEPFTKQQLADYLERATCIMLDHEKGTGPVENSMVQLDVTWCEMRSAMPLKARSSRSRTCPLPQCPSGATLITSLRRDLLAHGYRNLLVGHPRDTRRRQERGLGRKRRSRTAAHLLLDRSRDREGGAELAAIPAAAGIEEPPIITKDQIAAARDVLVKALTHPEKPLILGLDLDGVIDENPKFFSVLSAVWPGDLFIITYRSDRDRAVADLERFSIKYTDVILVNSFAEKADVIARLGIDVYIDDQDEILASIGENVTVLKMRNGGNYDAIERKWLYSATTGRPV